MHIARRHFLFTFCSANYGVVYPYHVFFQIVMVGVKGNGAAGDISVDDTSLRAGKCGVSPSQALVTPAPPTPTTAATTTAGEFRA